MGDCVESLAMKKKKKSSNSVYTREMGKLLHKNKD